MPSATQHAVPLPDDTTSSDGGLFLKKRSHEEFVAAGPIHDRNHSRDDVLAIFVNSGGNNGSSGGSRMPSAALSSRPMLPLAKRVRVDEIHGRTSPTRPSSQAAHDRELLSAPAKTNDPISTATTATTTNTTKTPPPTSLTTPCHICQRRPRRKCDLDSFSDCDGCGERTCFVCLRECLGLWERPQQQPLPVNGETQDVYDGCGYDRTTGGDTPSDGSMTPNDDEQQTGQDLRLWPGDDENTQLAAAAADGGLLRGRGDANHQPQQHPWGSTPQTRGHRRTVCSRCCVERGTDGAVVCLGCLAHAGSG